jgi:hypothetical protein
VVRGKPTSPRLWPPPVSVKDRSVGPHEQVLNVPIAYWCYGPSKSSSRPSIDAWLCPHCFIGWLGREARYEPVDRSAARCGLCREPFFSGAVGACSTLSITCERLARTGTPHGKHTPGVCGLVWKTYVVCWSGFPLQGVHRFKSP